MKTSKRVRAESSAETLPPAPSILTQPASHIGVVDDYTTFTVSAQSQAPVPMYYQWSRDGTNMAGATKSELVLSSLTLASAGTYAVQVSNPFFATNSQTAVLTMIPAPAGTNRIVANLDPNELTRAVQAGGSVTFVCEGNIVLLQPLVPSRDVVLDGSNSVSIVGAEQSQLLCVPSGVRVTLRNLAMVGGLAVAGGAISNSGVLSVGNVIFAGDIATWMGGAIYNTGTAILTGVTFSNNDASVYFAYRLPGNPYPGDGDGLGGAICNSNGAISLIDVVFSGNVADGTGNRDGYGGGLFNEGGTVTLQNVCFNGNAAQGGSDDNFLGGGQGYGFGGALYSSGGWISGSAIECTNNAALSGTGYLVIPQGWVASSPPGAGEGGAFCITNCTMVLSNGWFVSNSTTCTAAINTPLASSEGGALFNAGWVALTDIGFFSNYCLGADGAPGSALSDDPAIGTPGGPASGGTGGAVCNLGLLQMTNCTFAVNFVTASNGGAGSICAPCNPQYTAPSGAPGNALGGALANFGTVTIVSNAFLNNSAIGPGSDVGTIYSVGNLDIDPSTTILPDTVDSNPGAFAPLLVLGPQSQVVAAGTTVTLTALAVGSPAPTYQWSWDGTNLPLATAPALVLTNVQTSQSGSYSVKATNSVGSETSAPIQLTVLAAPITLTGNNLGPTGFSISGFGVPGLNFVIEVSTNLVNWQPLQTNPSPFTFTDTNTPASANRFYRAVIAY